MNKEALKSHIATRFESYPGMPIPEELIDEALKYIPERLADKFSVLYVQSPADWNRVSADIGAAIEEWNAGNRCEATLKLVKVLLESCI